MRIALLVDSACDLPRSFIDQHEICVIPSVISVGGRTFEDRRDAAKTLDFYQHQIGTATQQAQAAPCSAAMLRDCILREVLPRSDFAVYETVSRARSPAYETAMAAAAGIINDGRVLRKAANAAPFVLRVVNSRSVMVGQGLLAAETIRMIRAGVPVNELRNAVEKLGGQVRVYVVPKDLHYLHARARAKGDHAVSWLSATFDSVLDVKPVLECNGEHTVQVGKIRSFDAAVHRLFSFAGEQIAAGLSARHVVVGYGGDAAQIGALPGYADLVRVAKKHSIELMACGMGMAAGINLGAGMVSVAFASERAPVWN
ncbi:MAG TPA: DegV family protein [Solimonas sp.]|nr:DegV family protein [Solimonas sp.]